MKKARKTKSLTEEDRIFAEMEADLPEDIHDLMIDGRSIGSYTAKSWLNDGTLND